MFRDIKTSLLQAHKADKLKEKQAVVIKELIAPIRKKQTRYGGRKLFLDIANDLKKIISKWEEMPFLAS